MSSFFDPKRWRCSAGRAGVRSIGLVAVVWLVVVASKKSSIFLLIYDCLVYRGQFIKETETESPSRGGSGSDGSSIVWESIYCNNLKVRCICEKENKRDGRRK